MSFSYYDSNSYGHSRTEINSTFSVNGSLASEAATLKVSSPNTSDCPSCQRKHSTGPPTIPLHDKTISNGRSIVLCFDGTGDQSNSNVVQFLSMLKKDDPERQLVYYQAGIGTYNNAHFVTHFATEMSQTLDTAIAWNLGSHILDGYKFVMQNYREGDRLCIFGFSRGAYTARCLVGMIDKVGVLPSWNTEQLPFAYSMYNDTSLKGLERSRDFRHTFSTKVDIHFVGVWDTVESVGIIPREKPFATSDNVVRHFRHALALDEHRAKFKANTWNYLTEREKMILHYLDERDAKNGIAVVAERPASDVKEVWFAGCHCDVGGGSVSNDTRYNMARIPLRWMIRECFKANTGIIFYERPILNLGMDSLLVMGSPENIKAPKMLSGLGQTYLADDSPKDKVPEKLPNGLQEAQAMLRKRLQSMAPAKADSEDGQSLMDALSPEYDQLKLKWWWRIFELIPLTQRYQNVWTDEWEYVREWNRKSGRLITGFKSLETPGPDDERLIYVHSSVKTRLEATPKDGDAAYMPRAQVEDYQTEWRKEDGTVYEEPKLTELEQSRGWFTWLWVTLGFRRNIRTPPPKVRVVYVD
ncbi:hypothetical protein M422DRAFT_172643 [Sphaerobolus stellatus SS14]|uniref:T6SS Phospholipase effector Tle1-like catalytic domain-containing protein n=1 Tax=Sphaerobolus stellatus (strain SS14) TaxID=990650 RepID=A0A0C9VS75_SPHS4|nr:hypothetical protein M422DRAFT_172643 [Sphaerobolus stellatus SS14]